ncbi:DUF5327 family protein [Aureibacillus halotolerans]|uniref:YwdI family protein n=1 Tax=Aureibacillus halotolerans TaxID=1508390 RepID=A0A4R6TY04_9BACI|nr:DUF5327 family protein [Aureibacillus halotolerans]TDQ38790.1 hypothetical protein EV213_109159 [Aureibacillus halotolerans]
MSVSYQAMLRQMEQDVADAKVAQQQGNAQVMREKVAAVKVIAELLLAEEVERPAAPIKKMIVNDSADDLELRRMQGSTFQEENDDNDANGDGNGKSLFDF